MVIRRWPTSAPVRSGSGVSVTGDAELVQNAVEVLDRGEIYSDLAFFCAEGDVHLRAEVVSEALGHLVEMRAPGSGLRPGARAGSGGRARLRRRLGRAHREVLI